VSRARPHRASGAALLGLLLLLVFATLAFFTRQAVSFNDRATRDRLAARALAEARETLLGYATAYPELKAEGGRAVYVPGHLPCPDLGDAITDEGDESGNCGEEGEHVIGHFPWQSLGMSSPRDGQGECLWYAVAGAYKANPKGRLLNPDIPGVFRVEDARGRVLAEDVVAVLFAPGAALPGQEGRAAERDEAGRWNRECRWDYDARRFLEQDLPAGFSLEEHGGVIRFVAGAESEGFNDRLAWITRAELFDRAKKRPLWRENFFDPEFFSRETPALAQRVAACLARFGEQNPQHRLPWAAPLALSGTPAFANDAFKDQTGLLAGRPPFLVTRSHNLLSASFGSLAGCAGDNADCRLLRVENCPELALETILGAPSEKGAARGGWFDKWKDHLFYVVAPGFAPNAAPAADCLATPGQCLEVAGRPYAAAVIFSGAPQAGQSRATLAERMDAAQYLEGENAVTLHEHGRRLEAAGNDEIVCLSPEGEGFALVSDCAAR
jgi:hypothetical protein